MTALPPIVDAKFLASAGPGSTLPAPTAAEVAFAGRSNVGKSSLMNALMNRRNLVRTSSTPGCTRAVNLFEARAQDGLVVHLVDLPGYGYAKRSKAEKTTWGPLLEGYLHGRASLRSVVVLVDVRRGLEEEERDLLEFLGEPAQVSRPPLDVLVVATKLDKLPSSQRKTAVAAIAKAGVRVIGVSSETGEGKDDLWRRIRRTVGGSSTETVAPA